VIVFLAHAKANYTSTKDGYVMGLRTMGHVHTLQSFHFLEGCEALSIHENLRSVLDEQQLDEHGLRGGAAPG
jgi:hypothetical protein